MKSTVLRLVPLLLSIVTALFLVLILIGKFHLGQIRYFDADELAYLHWAHNVFLGRRPYLDFFFYIPSLFLWFLAPLYFVVHGISILAASRVVAWSVFVGMTIVAGALFCTLRQPKNRAERLWSFVIPGFILSFLPLPADKMLEMRPDTLAVLVSLVGLLFQLWWIEQGKKKWALWSGICYSVSLLILPKTMPLVAVATLVALGVQVHAPKNDRSLRVFFLGLGIPLGLFGLYVLGISRNLSDIQTIWYSLTILPFEVNRIGQQFPMQPDLFFYPNTVYYGVGGWSRGLIANHIVWTCGLLFGMGRLVTPVFGSKDTRGVWKEILVAAALLAYIVTFMYGYPVRHAQYLIPIAFFVSLYAADLVLAIWRTLRTPGWSIIFALGYSALLVGSWYIYTEVNTPKMGWTNAVDVQTLSFALQTIPKDDYVLDLVGATIYFRDPYYGCCLPFGQYSPYLSKPLPSMAQALANTHTSFIYQGRLFRVHDVSLEDQQFITRHYKTYPSDPSWFIQK